MSEKFWKGYSIKNPPNKQGLGKTDPPVSEPPNMNEDSSDKLPKPRRAPKSPSNPNSR